MAEKENEFLQRLMVATCDKGNLQYQYLNIPKDHGVYYQDLDHPLLNANDHKPDQHILQFGRCTSETNPKNMMGDVLCTVFPQLNVLKWAKAKMSKGKNTKEGMETAGCKCSPKTIKVWEHTNLGNCLDGADGILRTSTLTCFYGGTITITDEPEDPNAKPDENAEEEEPDTPEKHMPAEVAKMVDAMNQENAAEAASEAGGNSAGGEGAGAGASSGGAGGGASGGLGVAASAGQGGPTGVQGSIAPQPSYAERVANAADSQEASDIIMDTVGWYDDNPDYGDLYAVSPAIIQSNYANNMQQLIASDAVNDDGYICNCDALNNFCMGKGTAAQVGKCVAATYNLLSYLGEVPDLGKMIMQAESRQMIKGIMDQGPMGICMLSQGSTLAEQGKKISYKTPSAFLEGKGMEDTKCLMIGNSFGGETSYNTFRKSETGEFVCLENNELGLEHSLKNSEGTKMIMEVC